MILGPYTLSPGVLWINEITAPAVAQQMDFTVLGNVHIHNAPILKKEIVLEARDSGKRSRGYFTREQVDYLRAAELSGSTVPMQYRGVSYSTIVKAGGVALVPKKEIETVDNEDPHTGTVTLQEI